jgi:hypothetical protein
MRNVWNEAIMIYVLFSNFSGVTKLRRDNFTNDGRSQEFRIRFSDNEARNFKHSTEILVLKFIMQKIVKKS